MSLRLLGGVAVGAVLGVGTAVLGTAGHLFDVRLAAETGLPELGVGLLLAIGLVVSTDLFLAAASLSPPVLVASGAGRAAAFVPFLLPGPGGNVVLTGNLTSTIWVMVAVLVPSFLAVPLAGLARRQRSTAAA